VNAAADVEAKPCVIGLWNRGGDSLTGLQSHDDTAAVSTLKDRFDSPGKLAVISGLSGEDFRALRIERDLNGRLRQREAAASFFADDRFRRQAQEQAFLTAKREAVVDGPKRTGEQIVDRAMQYGSPNRRPAKRIRGPPQQSGRSPRPGP